MPSCSRRGFLAAASLACAAPLGRLRAAAPKSGYNVLFIAVDDLRPDLGCYGNSTVASPNIDRLAGRGLLFDQAYCQQAVCGPTRASLLTGLRPDSTRVWDNATHFRDTVPEVVTLPQHFKQNGYFTQAFGKILHGKMADARSWSVPAWPEGGRQAGMQYVDTDKLAKIRKASPDKRLEDIEIPTLTWKKHHSWQAPEVPDNAIQDGQSADRAVAALREIKDQPFFLAVGFLKPHMPFTAPKKYFDMYSPSDLETAENPFQVEGVPPVALHGWEELRGYQDIPREGPLPEGKALELIHGYYAATSYMDAQVGRVLGELNRLGLEDNTVVILWGDHGYHLGEHDLWCKATNFELDTRAPLILSVPGMSSAGARTDRLVEFVDIYPTLSEACGLPLPKHLEGLSMMPLTEEPAREWKKAAFSQFRRPWPGKGEWTAMGYSMTTGAYRYTEWVDPNKEVLARELYDHAADPDETVNVAGKPGSRELVSRLSDVLNAGWRAALPAQ